MPPKSRDSAAASFSYGQRKTKNRSSSQLTDHPYLSPVQLDDRLCDGQSHPSALDNHALVTATVKLFEDHLFFDFVDSWTVIGHARDHLRTFQIGAHSNWSLGRRVLSSVVEKVTDHLSDSFQIHSNGR